VTDKGEIFTGRVIDENDKVLRMRTHPYATKLTTINKADIDTRELSKVSEMPVGLINVLSKEEILDLIAYMRSGGNPDDAAFKK